MSLFPFHLPGSRSAPPLPYQCLRRRIRAEPPAGLSFRRPPGTCRVQFRKPAPPRRPPGPPPNNTLRAALAGARCFSSSVSMPRQTHPRRNSDLLSAPLRSPRRTRDKRAPLQAFAPISAAGPPATGSGKNALPAHETPAAVPRSHLNDAPCKRRHFENSRSSPLMVMRISDRPVSSPEASAALS